MPSNDDMQHQGDKATSDRVTADAADSSILPNENVFGDNEVIIGEGGKSPLSSENFIQPEFTFFQKKKRSDRTLIVPSLSHASIANVTAFVSRLDVAVAANNKTQRHIAELMILTSDVARTMTKDLSSSTQKRFCWSKWLFYGCLVGSGVGWFLLFPTGHDLMTQLAVFLLR